MDFKKILKIINQNNKENNIKLQLSDPLESFKIFPKNLTENEKYNIITQILNK